MRAAAARARWLGAVMTCPAVGALAHAWSGAVAMARAAVATWSIARRLVAGHAIPAGIAFACGHGMTEAGARRHAYSMIRAALWTVGSRAVEASPARRTEARARRHATAARRAARRTVGLRAAWSNPSARARALARRGAPAVAEAAALASRLARDTRVARLTRARSVDADAIVAAASRWTRQVSKRAVSCRMRAVLALPAALAQAEVWPDTPSVASAVAGADGRAAVLSDPSIEALAPSRRDADTV